MKINTVCHCNKDEQMTKLRRRYRQNMRLSDIT